MVSGLGWAIEEIQVLLKQAVPMVLMMESCLLEVLEREKQQAPPGPLLLDLGVKT